MDTETNAEPTLEELKQINTELKESYEALQKRYEKLQKDYQDCKNKSYALLGEAIRLRRMMEYHEEDLKVAQGKIDAAERRERNLRLWMKTKGIYLYNEQPVKGRKYEYKDTTDMEGTI